MKLPVSNDLHLLVKLENIIIKQFILCHHDFSVDICKRLIRPYIKISKQNIKKYTSLMILSDNFSFKDAVVHEDIKLK